MDQFICCSSVAIYYCRRLFLIIYVCFNMCHNVDLKECSSNVAQSNHSLCCTHHLFVRSFVRYMLLSGERPLAYLSNNLFIPLPTLLYHSFSTCLSAIWRNFPLSFGFGSIGHLQATTNIYQPFSFSLHSKRGREFGINLRSELN